MAVVTKQPATPLPWRVLGKHGHTIWAGNEIIFQATHPRSRGTGAHKDAAYIEHAINAYPRLIEALHKAAYNGAFSKDAERLLRELGETE